MWYRLAYNLDRISKRLLSKGTDAEVIDFVQAADPIEQRIYLHNLLQNPNLTIEDLKKIEAIEPQDIHLNDVKKLEREIYPSHMLHMQHIQDLDEYTEAGDLGEGQSVALGEAGKWYCVIAIFPEHKVIEVVDIAAHAPYGERAFRAISNYMGKYKGYIFHADARETTSYPLVRSLADAGRIRLLSENETDEKMEELGLDLEVGEWNWGHYGRDGDLRNSDIMHGVVAEIL
jgi:hypothetical protein